MVVVGEPGCLETVQDEFLQLLLRLHKLRLIPHRRVRHQRRPTREERDREVERGYERVGWCVAVWFKSSLIIYFSYSFLVDWLIGWLII